MQRLAHIAGLAYLSPSHLNVHATYGPRIAPAGRSRDRHQGPAGPSPEPRSERHCLSRFREAIAAAGATPAAHAAIERYWLAVRDACPVGRSHRYGDEQIRDHYTKDRAVLRRIHGSAGP